MNKLQLIDTLKIENGLSKNEAAAAVNLYKQGNGEVPIKIGQKIRVFWHPYGQTGPLGRIT